ncbi:MAG: ABC transporter substrate-binding protein [Halorientalis sp.]
MKNNIPVERRSFLRATGATAAVAGLAGCRGSDSGSGKFKIGALAPMDSPVGPGIANGAKLAAKEINKNGGINGSDIEIIAKDTKGDSSTGKKRFQNLVLEDQVDVTVGVFVSEVLMAIMDDIAQTQNVHMTTGAATPRASAKVNSNYDKYKYHFRTGPLNSAQLGENLADFALAKFPEIGWNKVAMLLEDYEWTKPIENVVAKKLGGSSDIEVVMKERFPADTNNYATLYNSVESNDADAAFVAMAHTGGTAVSSWARDRRPFGFGGVHVPSQLPSFYDSSMGTAAYTVTQNVATPQSEITDQTQPFIKAYKKQFEKLPAFTAYLTHDAVKQYAQTVANMDSDPKKSDNVVKALEQSSYTGTIGTIEYHGKGHEYAHDLIYSKDHVNPVFQQWQPHDGGTQEVVYPPEYATSEYQQPNWISK